MISTSQSTTKDSRRMVSQTRDTCTTCKRTRTKRERWFFVYPDILNPMMVLAAVAVYCPPCAALAIPDRVNRRRARLSAAHRRPSP